jgi:hypothetical protein
MPKPSHGNFVGKVAIATFTANGDDLYCHTGDT